MNERKTTPVHAGGSWDLLFNPRAAWESLTASPYSRLALKAGTVLFTLLAEQVSPPENAWVLDIGCGAGGLDVSLAERFPAAYFTGVDESAAQVRQASRLSERRLAANCSFVRANPTRLPFAEASFEIALSVSSLRYWSDPAKCLHEMRRILVNDGRVFIVELDIEHTEQELSNLTAALKSSARSFSVSPSGRRARMALLEQGVSRKEASDLAWSSSLKDVTTRRVGGGMPIFLLEARARG